MRLPNYRAVVLPAALLLFLLPAQARAHGLGAEAKVKDGQVHVEGYFDDDTPAADARVSVQDEAKNVVAEGKMDAQGRYSFPSPAPGKYRVIVNAGGGHRAAIPVTIPPSAASHPAITAQPENQPAEVPVRVSEGQSREEFTRFPWERLGLGLGLIALAAVAAFFLSRALRPQPTDETVKDKTP